MGVSIFAPAKINLSLHVGPPRGDGRHPLASIVAFADVGDVVTIEEGANALDVSGPFAAALDGENLISRALGLLGVSARVHLQKNLPVASGMGGGSADAAAALVGANEVLQLGLDEAALRAAAAKLGADVPVCVAGRPAFMSGTGEIVTPIDLPDLHAVLVNPAVAVSTAAVYRKFDEAARGADLSAEAPPRWRDSSAAIAGLARMRNDLEAPARALAPVIGEVLARLSAAPEILLARMSGSGATCVALVKDHDAAAGLAAALGAERPAWWVRAARLGAAPTIDAAARPG